MVANIPEGSPHYGEPATLDEARRFLDLADEAFSADSPHLRAALERDGWSHIRTLKVGDELAAGLIIHRSGQWFGGRRLASHAIAAVAAAPHFRRQGMGSRLMLSMIREARGSGVPLSVLYASEPAFYRALGYEPAGNRCVFQAETRKLPEGSNDAVLSARSREEQETLRGLYRKFAAAHSGCLDRGKHFWRSIFAPPDESKRYLYCIEFDGALEGYLCVGRSRKEDALFIRDVVCTTSRASRAALAFMSRYSSLASSVIFTDGPQGPLRKHIAGNDARPAFGVQAEWLLRITDVATALRERGYPKLDLELHLEVADDAIEENAGRYVLHVGPGSAAVEPGGSGRIRLDVRALAAIYTGYCHPREMREAGLLDGPETDLDRLGLAFAGPRPFMLDDF